jgi:hypothetical protein
MAIKITRWYPDTCECIIEYKWDDSIEENSRIHSYNNTIKYCAFHEKYGGKKEHFDVVKLENETKNTMLFNVSSLDKRLQKIDANGQVSVETDKLKWHFGPSREIVIDIVDKDISIPQEQIDLVTNEYQTLVSS